MNWILFGLGLLFLVYIILIIVYVVDAYKKKRTETLIDYNITLPSVEYVRNNDKIIWSYWGQTSDYSFITKVAIHSWKYSNPDYKIAMLTPTMIYQYLEPKDLPDNYSILNQYRREDAVKLAILEKYGGVWVGTNVLLTRSITPDWIPFTKFGAFYITDKTVTEDYPVLDTSFLVVPRQSPVIQKWKTEAFTLITADILSNIRNLVSQLNLGNKLIRMSMAVSHLLQYAFIKVMTELDDKTVLDLKSGNAGPYQHRSVSSLKLLTTPVQLPVQPILILLSDTRNSITNGWYLLTKDSLMDRIVRKDTVDQST